MPVEPRLCTGDECRDRRGQSPGRDPRRARAGPRSVCVSSSAPNQRLTRRGQWPPAPTSATRESGATPSPVAADQRLRQSPPAGGPPRSRGGCGIHGGERDGGISPASDASAHRVACVCGGTAPSGQTGCRPRRSHPRERDDDRQVRARTPGPSVVVGIGSSTPSIGVVAT